MALKKNFIGKGKQVKDFDMVDVTLKWSGLEQHLFEFEGEKYLRFTVAGLQEPDQFEKTHTVYVTSKEDEPKKKTKK